jgi:hypothetical protein
MKHLALVLVALLAVGLAGCASMSTGDRLNGQKLNDDTPVAHLNAGNWGFYFLWFGVITGDASTPSGGIALLDDSVNVPDMVDMVTMGAKEKGASKVVDLTSTYSSFWIPPFFFIKSCEVSGNAVK